MVLCCAYEECNKQPSFNIDGKKPLYCFEHKKDSMINVKHKTCAEEGCKKQPKFNIEEEKKGLYCGVHKKEGMVDVVNKKCAHEGCYKQPSYNIEEEKKGLYCGVHKKEGMVDVVNKKCAHEGCNTIPYFNIEGEKRGLYCIVHKKDCMIDVVSKTCINEWYYNNIKYRCINRPSNPKYRGYCISCFIRKFPDEPVIRNYKTKENAVVQYIKSKFPDLSWIADRKIQDGCSGRRPDLILDLGFQVLIIEVDEHKHNDYECSCENKRIMQLSQDVAHRSIVFIRFNPDDYMKVDKKITSCWGIDGHGYAVVKKTKKKEWETRLNSIKLQIEYWMNNATDKLIETVQLFYDED